MEHLVDLMNRMPFGSQLGIEITEAEDGHAAAHLSIEDWHSSSPRGTVAHGGVTYSLADSVAGAAAMSLNEPPTPTVDMRIDYLAPATEDLYATAEVVRDGGHLCTVDVEVTDGEGTTIATANGVYKTDGSGGSSPWEGTD